MADITTILDEKKAIITNLTDASVKYGVAIEALGRMESENISQYRTQEVKVEQYGNQVNTYRSQMSIVNQKLADEFKRIPEYKCTSCDDKTPGKVPMFLGLQFNCVCEGTQLRVDARILVQTESKHMIRSLEERVKHKLVSTH